MHHLDRLLAARAAPSVPCRGQQRRKGEELAEGDCTHRCEDALLANENHPREEAKSVGDSVSAHLHNHHLLHHEGPAAAPSGHLC